MTHSIVSRTWKVFQTTGTAVRQFSGDGARATTAANDRYIVQQAKWVRRINRKTHLTGYWVIGILFFRCQETAYSRSNCTKTIRCVPLSSDHRRLRILWCREHEKCTD